MDIQLGILEVEGFLFVCLFVFVLNAAAD